MNDQRKTKKQLLKELVQERERSAQAEERSLALQGVSNKVAAAHETSEEGMDIGYMEIAKTGAQSFALFIGFSILLGRLYLMRYTEKLGIPVSSIDIGLTDHAIFSPDMVIMSVVVAISITLLLVLAPTNPQNQSAVWKWFNALRQIVWWPSLLGIAAVTFGGYLVAVNPSEWFSWTSELPVGVSGAVRASGGIVMSIGLIVIALALSEKLKTWLAIAVRRVGYATALGILIYSLSESVATFASDDAFKSVAESPAALLEVDPIYSPTNLIDIDSTKDGVLVPVNIVHITNNFTYVVNHLEAECAKKQFVSLNQARGAKDRELGGTKGALPISAIPNGSIHRLQYINNSLLETADCERYFDPVSLFQGSSNGDEIVRSLHHNRTAPGLGGQPGDES